MEEGKTAAAVATGKGGGALECPVDGCTKQIFDATLKQLLSEEVRLSSVLVCDMTCHRC